MELDEQREEKIDRDELIKMKNEKAEQVVQSRILTQAEHEMIKAEQALKNVVDIRRNKTMGLDQSANSSNLVPLSKIELVGSRRVSFLDLKNLLLARLYNLKLNLETRQRKQIGNGNEGTRRS